VKKVVTTEFVKKVGVDVRATRKVSPGSQPSLPRKKEKCLKKSLERDRKDATEGVGSSGK